MKPVEFQGQTDILGPPKGWDNSGDITQVGYLPVQIFVDDGLPFYVSFWRPSEEDLAALNDGAHIRLSVISRTLPPVCVSIEKVEEMP